MATYTSLLFETEVPAGYIDSGRTTEKIWIRGENHSWDDLKKIVKRYAYRLNDCKLTGIFVKSVVRNDEPPKSLDSFWAHVSDEFGNYISAEDR